MFSVHTKQQSWRFQIIPVLRAFAKSSPFWRRTAVAGGLTVEINLCFSNFSLSLRRVDGALADIVP